MNTQPMWLRSRQPEPEPSAIPAFVALLGFALFAAGVVGVAMRVWP